MNRTPARLYDHSPAGTLNCLFDNLEQGLAKSVNSGTIPVFFRADDIGVPSTIFADLLGLFDRYQVPLCLAIVPTWLTKARWGAFKEICNPADPLWCWHQHGWGHINHEPSGKKSEFGRSRQPDQIKQDLTRGKKRLKSLLGASFQPYFTPPWNRCSPETLDLISALGFKAVSSSRAGLVPSESTCPLPDIPVNVDLHTRKEPDFNACLVALAQDIKQAATAGRIGMMLHHQRMNRNAFSLLEALLRHVVENPRLEPVSFSAFG